MNFCDWKVRLTINNEFPCFNKSNVSCIIYKFKRHCIINRHFFCTNISHYKVFIIFNFFSYLCTSRNRRRNIKGFFKTSIISNIKGNEIFTIYNCIIVWKDNCNRRNRCILKSCSSCIRNISCNIKYSYIYFNKSVFKI